MSTTNGVELWVAVGTAVSALATSGSAIVIGVQAYFTRKAVEVAEEATALSKRIAVEATKTRLDARAPLITVTRVGDVEWPPLEPSAIARGEPNPLPVGREYHLPRDATDLVLVRSRIRVSNRSPADVRMDVGSVVALSWTPGWPPPASIEIASQANVDLYVQQVRTVAEWVAISQQRADGSAGDPIIGYLRHSDAADDGVIDRWEVHLVGSPLRPSPDLDGVWLVAQQMRSDAMYPTIGIDLRPVARDYYLSKSEDLRLV